MTDSDEGAKPLLDYQPCRYGASKLIFRGPRRRAGGDHLAVLGGVESYGKFLREPWPDLLEQELRREVVNLSQVNAGVDVFRGDAAVLDICQRAACTIIKLTGAQNISNRYYAVHPRRNDRFLRASGLLKTLYRDTDFTEFNFTRHLMHSLSVASPQRFAVLAAELKEAWVARMQQLIERIHGPVVLLWIGDAPPPPGGSLQLSEGAMLVDRHMIDVLRPRVSSVVEIVSSAEEKARERDRMVFAPMDAAAADRVAGPAVHRRIAGQLAELLPWVLAEEAARAADINLGLRRGA